MKKLKDLLKNTVGFLLRMLFCFIVIEGVCSVLVLCCRGSQSVGHVQAGGKNAQFDPDIGWVNIPNFKAKDLYGPGGDTQTNSRGFRNDKEFDAKVPAGKFRVLCSGDSFTFGYGVANDFSLCQQLAEEDPRLEAVNLGVPGYGLDQMYLLYKREGLKLEHDVHFVAVIKEDFKRMGDSKFLGANKPVIRLKDGALVVNNVPVVKGGYSMTGLTGTITTFDAARFITLYRTLFPNQKSDAPVYRSHGQLMETALAVFEDLGRLGKENNSTFVAVFLPMADDIEDAPLYQTYLATELAKRNVLFIDLTGEFKALPPAKRTPLFIPKSAKNEQFAAGHYSAAGNLMVAKALWKKIAAFPAVAEKLSRLSP